MDWDTYRAWLRRRTVEVTMTDPATTPTTIPTVQPLPAPPKHRGPTRDQLYPELITATLAWRNHLRCGTNRNCQREHMEWIDLLLDEWLDAPA